MENSISNTKKDTQERECEDTKLIHNGNLSKRLVTKVNGEPLMILSIKRPQTNGSCIQESLLQGISSLETKIPIQILSFDEIYLRHCLELVHFSAFPKTTSNLSMGCTFESADFGIECPSVSADGNSILGTITRSQSMINILKSPLFQNFSGIDTDANLGTSLTDGGESTCSDFTSSSSGFFVGSTQKLRRDMVVLGDNKFGSDPAHKRVFSVSSTNSTCSDGSSSSTYGSISHGILQCTWFDGTPHFVFSLDDQRSIYVANLLKSKSVDDKDLDYMYTFHSSTGHEKDSDLVGKMKVSTLVKLFPNNTQVLETQFVLFGFSDAFASQTQTPTPTHNKNKGLSKKVGSIFRVGDLSKQRISSKFVGSSAAIPENSSLEPNQDCGAISQEYDLLPNNELAAIIVRNHIHEAREEPRIGGWGLNFLRKVGHANIRENEVLLSDRSCQRNVGDCSTNMDIIIPAGFHGGPRTRNGGPTSLIEKWGSGGKCDCGGWDIGCPFTVLESNPNEGLTEDVPEESRTIDIFVKGSKQGAPILKMNGHDYLYEIHFQSHLSALQSFAIAAAIIHSRSPSLSSKVHRR